MTSIFEPEYYYDTIEIHRQGIPEKKFLTENEPLSLVLQLVYNRGSQPYWSRGYKAHWILIDEQLFLSGLNGVINDEEITLHSLFSNEIMKSGSDKIFASWYSGEIKITTDFWIKEEDDGKFDCFKFRTYQIKDGKVTGFTDSYKESETDPF